MKISSISLVMHMCQNPFISLIAISVIMPGHNELMVFIIISPVSEGYVMVLLYPPYPLVW